MVIIVNLYFNAYSNEITAIKSALAISTADFTIQLSIGAIIAGYAYDTADNTLPNVEVTLLQGTSIETATPIQNSESDDEGFYIFSVAVYDPTSFYYVTTN